MAKKSNGPWQCWAISYLSNWCFSRTDNPLFTYCIELVSPCGMDQRNCHGSASCCKGFYGYFWWTRCPVLKYHAHIFDITWRRKRNPIRNKQSTWKTQIALNRVLTHVRIFPVMNSIATLNSSWKMEVSNTVKKNPSTAGKVTAPI